VSKSDFGRFWNRGANNPRIWVTTLEPKTPIKNDIWINPDYKNTQYISKANNTSRNTTTLSDDPDLADIELQPYGYYYVEAILTHSGPDGGNILTEWSSSNVTGFGHKLTRGIAPGESSPHSANIKNARYPLIATSTSTGTDNTLTWHNEQFFLYTGASVGTFTLRWAQNGSLSGDTILTDKSLIIIHQIGGTRAQQQYYDGSDWVVLL